MAMARSWMLVDELVDHAGREPGAHQPAVAGVLRRIHVQDRHADHLERLGRLVLMNVEPSSAENVSWSRLTARTSA